MPEDTHLERVQFFTTVWMSIESPGSRFRRIVGRRPSGYPRALAGRRERAQPQAGPVERTSLSCGKREEVS
jgi:hypothetical protein